MKKRLSRLKTTKIIEFQDGFEVDKSKRQGNAPEYYSAQELTNRLYIYANSIKHIEKTKLILTALITALIFVKSLLPGISRSTC